MSDVAGGEHHAFGFARGAGGVDDGDEIGLGKLCGVAVATLAPACAKISSKQNIAAGPPASACRMPSRNAASPQQISAGEQSFIMATSSAGGLARIERNHDQPSAMSARSSATQSNAVVRQQGAAIAFFQTLDDKERAGLRDQFQQFWLPVTPWPVLDRGVRCSNGDVCGGIAAAQRFGARKVIRSRRQVMRDGYAVAPPPIWPQASTLLIGGSNLPNSIRLCGWEIRDSAAALLLRNTRPCAPSLLDSSPRSGRFRRRCASPSVASFSRAASSFGSRSGSSTVISRSCGRARASGCGCVRPW